MEERGIVLEIDGDEVILLSSSGEFRRQPIVGEIPEIGAEIPVLEPSIQPVKNRIKTPLIWISVVAAAAMVLAFNLEGLFGGKQPAPLVEQPVQMLAAAPVLSVTVDINPSVELGFDADTKVVQVKGLNDDGQKLLAALGDQALLGVSGDEALEKITFQAMEMGFLTQENGNSIVIAIAGDETQIKSAGLEDRLKRSVQKAVTKKNLGTVIQTVRVSEEAKREAQEAGLSPGKYAIYLEALDKGLKVSIADFKSSSITKVIKEAGGNPGEIIGKAHDRQELQEKAARFKEHIKSEIAKERSKNQNSGRPTNTERNEPPKADGQSAVQLKPDMAKEREDDSDEHKDMNQESAKEDFHSQRGDKKGD